MTDTTAPASTPPSVELGSISTTTPGWKTSEFWLKLLAFLLTALFAAGVIPTTGPVMQVATVAALMLGSLGYTVSRSYVKVNAMHAATNVKLLDAEAAAARARDAANRIHDELLIARKPQAGVVRPHVLVTLALSSLFIICGVVQLASYSGCASAKADIKVMSGAFATCAKADLGQVIASSGLTLLGTVAAAIEGNIKTLEDDFATLADTVGVDGVQCAIAAVESVLEPKPAAGASTSAKLPGLQRARAWSAAQSTRRP